MNRLLLLIVVAVVIIAGLIFFTNPGLLDRLWLWLIGFIGYVLILLEKGWKIIKDAFKKHNTPVPSLSSNAEPEPQHQIKALEEKILRIEQKLKAKENQQPLHSGLAQET